MSSADAGKKRIASYRADAYFRLFRLRRNARPPQGPAYKYAYKPGIPEQQFELFQQCLHHASAEIRIQTVISVLYALFEFLWRHQGGLEDRVRPPVLCPRFSRQKPSFLLKLRIE